MKHVRRSLVPFLLLLAITFSGCKKYLEFEGEDLEPRLVLNGLAMADSVVTVHLSNSRGVIDPSPIRRVTNATVNVYDGQGDLIEQLVHQGDGRYRGQVALTAGTVVSVQASADGFGSLGAQDLVPSAVPIEQWDTTSVIVPGGGGGFEFPALELAFTVTDPSDQVNFYMLEGYIVQADSIIYDWDPITGEPIIDTVPANVPQVYPVGFSSTDQVLVASGDAEVGDTRVYFTRAVLRDELFNGTRRTFNIRLDNTIRPGKLDLRWVSITNATYLYYRTLERYQYANEDPFAEPVQVYTNIEGGLGIWGGANIARVLIDL